MVLVPTRTDPSVQRVDKGYAFSLLGEEIPLDKASRFKIKVKLPASQATISIKCGDNGLFQEVWPGDSVYISFRNTDSIKQLGTITKAASGIIDSLEYVYVRSYRNADHFWLRDSVYRKIGIQAAFDSLDAVRAVILQRYSKGLAKSGVKQGRRKVLVRDLLRWSGALYFIMSLNGRPTEEESKEYQEWRSKRFYDLAPCCDRYIGNYSSYCEEIAKDRMRRHGRYDTTKVARLSRSFLEGYPGERKWNSRQRTALAIVANAKGRSYSRRSTPDTAELEWALAERAKRGYHTRADSVARAAFELYRAGLRRGHVERSFNNQAWSLGTQSELTPAGERTKAILVWCWLANSKAAMRQVGPLAEIEHRLRPLDVRSVHVCFDNGDRAMREELYQLGLQGEYWYSDRQVRGQLLDMLGLKRLEAPRLLLLSPDGHVLDAALPDATDVEGVVKRVGERL